jgi:hypothetical protein
LKSQIEGNEEDESDDELVIEQPKTLGFGSCDIVAQTTSEIISRSVNVVTSKMEQEPSSKRRKTLSQRISWIKEFGRHLNGRLDSLRSADLHRRRLERDLKLSRRRKAELRDEFLAIQRERDRIDLEIQEVRQKSAKETEAWEKANTLSTRLYNLQAAIARGRERAKELGRENEGPQLPLQMRLAILARQTSSNVSGGGLLESTKALNHALQHEAERLEGKLRQT